MKRILIALLLSVLFLGVSPAMAAMLYVDDDGLCGGNSPCYAHPQDAVNAAAPGDTILVYPGTYGTRYYPDCGWANCGCGDTSAPALIVYKPDLTIQATGTAGETIIESTHQCWSNVMPVTKSTGLVPDFGTAPNGVSVIASGVTLQGFTIRSAYMGDPNVNGDWPNTAGIMIGALYAGDKPPIGVTGTTVKDCIISGHSGIYNWRASNTLVDGDTITVLSPLSTAHNGNGIAVWDGYFEGIFPPTSTGVKVLNSHIDTTMLTAPGEGNGIMFGGTDSTGAGTDQSGMIIDGNTIRAFTDGVKFWHSIGSNKVITCNNDISFGSSGTGARASDRGIGDWYPPELPEPPASTWTDLYPDNCGTPVPEFPTLALPVITIIGLLVMVMAVRRMR